MTPSSRWLLSAINYHFFTSRYISRYSCHRLPAPHSGVPAVGSPAAVGMRHDHPLEILVMHGVIADIRNVWLLYDRISVGDPDQDYLGEIWW